MKQTFIVLLTLSNISATWHEKVHNLMPAITLKLLKNFFFAFFCKYLKE